MEGGVHGKLSRKDRVKRDRKGEGDLDGKSRERMKGNKYREEQARGNRLKYLVDSGGSVA